MVEYTVKQPWKHSSHPSSCSSLCVQASNTRLFWPFVFGMPTFKIFLIFETCISHLSLKDFSFCILQAFKYGYVYVFFMRGGNKPVFNHQAHCKHEVIIFSNETNGYLSAFCSEWGIFRQKAYQAERETAGTTSKEEATSLSVWENIAQANFIFLYDTRERKQSSRLCV